MCDFVLPQYLRRVRGNTQAFKCLFLINRDRIRGSFAAAGPN